MDRERKMKVSRHCPICKSDTGMKIAEMNFALFDDLKIPAHKTLVQCIECGLIYDDTLLSEDDLALYYTRNSHYEFVNSGNIGNFKLETQVRLDRIIDTIKIHTPSTNRILDIGCNRGELLLRCRERGITGTAGVELSNDARKSAIDNGLNVVSNLYELSGYEADIIVLSQIMEHLLQPLDMLYSLIKFAPGAFIYIEVPAAEGHFLCTPIEWERFFFEHIIHYTKESLQMLCMAADITRVADGNMIHSENVPVPCLWFIGRLPTNIKPNRFKYIQPKIFYPKLPSLCEEKIVKILDYDSPLAIWGLSQYAMLLLGNCPELLNRIQHLFDVSPAKIGRKIKGIIIEPLSNLASLSDDHVLLIPKSFFLCQMRKQLPEFGFKGLVIEL